ncbi:MAG: hypothetical protein COV45_08875 [Deltaproteobacteria bacterium CG11_big_fil_rev_8_21_14_0_20_47_16]|nr:MAG: hypothetical protein COV45_08875 [Deltaproteobacteria bacterium CG11_big_fil_rev_8_21_14_0_20_47_16]
MAKPIQKHQHIFATGKGTYYPGRTKPLVGIRLSPLAAYLQSHYSTFASPCGNKGDVYKITLVGQPALFRYALLNDRIMHHSCSVVGKAKDDDGKNLMPHGSSVPLVDLSVGLAEYFGIKGRKGIAQFKVRPVPHDQYDAVLDLIKSGVLVAHAK